MTSRFALALTALTASGLLIGCKGKSTAEFTPSCSSEFTEAYAELNYEAQNFNYLMEMYNEGRRDVRRELQRSAETVAEACEWLKSEVPSHACVNSSHGSTNTISVRDFESTCADAFDHLGRHNSGRSDLGRWNSPGNSRGIVENKSLSQMKADSLYLRIVNPALVKQSLQRDAALSFLNGQLVSLEVAKRGIAQGQTACALQARRGTLTQNKTLSFRDLQVRDSDRNSQQVLLISEEELRISCQKSGSLSVQDIYEALGGVIEIGTR